MDGPTIARRSLEITMSVHPPPPGRPGGPVTVTGPLSRELLAVSETWARSQQRLIALAAAFSESSEWVLAGSPTAAHWLASMADVEVCTAREWVRIGLRLAELPVMAAAFEAGLLSYSKVRTLTRLATPENEAELVDLALGVSASELGRVLAAWFHRNHDPEEIAAHHRRRRSVRWRTDPDGMVIFTLRLPPLVAAALIAWLTKWVMTSRRAATDSGDGASAGARPTVAQQHADGIAALVGLDDQGEHSASALAPSDGRAKPLTEIVVHVRGDGCSLDDGTPISESVVAEIAEMSFFRALLHDARCSPVNASGRQRHPTLRQQRVVKERDRVCRDCGRSQLLQCDHVPPFEHSRRTLVDELELVCASCHRRRHRAS